jgi:hypothetical protein
LQWAAHESFDLKRIGGSGRGTQIHE